MINNFLFIKIDNLIFVSFWSNIVSVNNMNIRNEQKIRKIQNDLVQMNESTNDLTKLKNTNDIFEDMTIKNHIEILEKNYNDLNENKGQYTFFHYLNAHKLSIKLNDIEKIITYINDMLFIYQKIFNKKEYEDNKWNLHMQDSKIFKMDKYMALFSNSIKEMYVKTDNIDNDMNLLIHHFNNNIQNKYVVKWKFFDDDYNDVNWVFIYIKRE